MNTAKRFLVCLFVMVAAAVGQAATLTLQQGTGGYSGCTDSYIGTGGYGNDFNQNFGECGTLIVNSEHYNAG